MYWYLNLNVYHEVKTLCNTGYVESHYPHKYFYE